MTEGTIAAAPVSRIQLRAYATAWRSAMGLGDEIYMPVSEILERLPLWFEEVGLSVEVVPVQELSGDDHAYFDPIHNRIVIREDVYEGACAGNGRDRMTVIHEFCHFALISQSGLKLSRRFDEIKKYEDPEWQAKALAGEFMMPADKIAGLSVEEIMERCGVSYEAAQFHYDLMNKNKAS